MFFVRLKILLFIFFLPRIVISYEFFSIGNEHVNFIVDICKLYRTKPIIFLYGQSIKEMEMKTTMFKLTRALSREGLSTTSFYLSELHKSFYHANRIVRPYYIAIISNDNDINEFSLVTSTLDMSFPMWLVLFIYNGHDPDYCHNPPDSLYERRYNLKGFTMRAVSIKSSPTIYMNRLGELDGLLGRMLRELCVTLNFSFKVVSEVDSYGLWDPKENIWTGAIGELYSGRADVSFSAFSMTKARLNVVDFTFPLLASKISLYIREPELFAFKWSSYFLTFSKSVWIAIFAVLIVVPILLIFLKMKDKNDRSMAQLLSDNFVDIWGIFCQQGLADFPNRSSLRIAYFSIILLATILSAAYSASFISFLTAGIHILPFHSLEGFVEDGTYKLSVYRGTAEYEMFANSNDPLEKKMMKLMLDEEELSANILEGFIKICEDPKLALYSSDLLRDAVFLEIPCKIVRLETGRVDRLAMVLSKDNPFTGVINFQLLKFINSGMNNRMKDLSSERKSSDMIQHQPIGINSVISLIFFILIGIILSIFILFIEKYLFDS
uniref:glutamate receptor 1-like isoform X3 n=1 Tax=Vespula vulgaris TaxID=7454 RepID=UPI00223C2438|nr:glutamate receptor 1-like isoform X3 [Vespula vulgaris]